MMRFGRTSLIFMLFFLLSPAAAVAITLQGSVGIEKPIGGREPALSAALHLFGSRRETLHFLVKATGGGCGQASLNLTAPLEQGGSVNLPFRLYRLETIRTRHASFPGAHIGNHFDPVIATTEICGGANNWFLAEVDIPGRMRPGTYNTSLAAGGARLGITLTVWRMTMPVEPTLPAYGELTTWFNLLGHYGQWVNQEPELAVKYAAKMREHRIYPLKSAITRPNIYMQNGRYYLDIDGSPTPRMSFSAVSLSERPPWALYDFPPVPRNLINSADTVAYLQAIENSIGQIGRGNQAFMYIWDEPSQREVRRMLRLARIIRRHAPSLKIMATVPYDRRFRRFIDIYVPVINHFGMGGYPGPRRYRRLQRQGKEAWWYISCMSHGCDRPVDAGVPDIMIDRPASSVRSIGWVGARTGINAFLYYSVNNGYQFHPRRDPWDSLWDFTGNGDGTLFYPGRPGERGFTEHEPVASLRLKLWRESSFDAEYVNWIRNPRVRPNWWRREFRRIASSPTRWSKNYNDYRELRERMGIHLDAVMAGGR